MYRTHWVIIGVLLQCFSLQAATIFGVDCIDHDPRGVKVIEVQESSFAQQMGIKKGDIIVMVNRKRVDSSKEFARELALTESVTITWRRGDKYFRGGLHYITPVSVHPINGSWTSDKLEDLPPPVRFGLNVVDHENTAARVTKVQSSSLGDKLALQRNPSFC